MLFCKTLLKFLIFFCGFVYIADSSGSGKTFSMEVRRNQKTSSETHTKNIRSLYELADKMENSAEREKRGDFKIVKIELEKDQYPSSCQRKTYNRKDPFLNVEIKKEYDLRNLDKSDYTTLLKKLNSVLHDLHCIKGKESFPEFSNPNHLEHPSNNMKSMMLTEPHTTTTTMSPTTNLENKTTTKTDYPQNVDHTFKAPEAYYNQFPNINKHGPFNNTPSMNYMPSVNSNTKPENNDQPNPKFPFYPQSAQYPFLSYEPNSQKPFSNENYNPVQPFISTMRHPEIVHITTRRPYDAYNGSSVPEIPAYCRDLYNKDPSQFERNKYNPDKVYVELAYRASDQSDDNQQQPQKPLNTNYANKNINHSGDKEYFNVKTNMPQIFPSFVTTTSYKSYNSYASTTEIPHNIKTTSKPNDHRYTPSLKDRELEREMVRNNFMVKSGNKELYLTGQNLNHYNLVNSQNPAEHSWHNPVTINPNIIPQMPMNYNDQKNLPHAINNVNQQNIGKYLNHENAKQYNHIKDYTTQSGSYNVPNPPNANQKNPVRNNYHASSVNNAFLNHNDSTNFLQHDHHHQYNGYPMTNNFPKDCVANDNNFQRPQRQFIDMMKKIWHETSRIEEELYKNEESHYKGYERQPVSNGYDKEMDLKSEGSSNVNHYVRPHDVDSENQSIQKPEEELKDLERLLRAVGMLESNADFYEELIKNDNVSKENRNRISKRAIDDLRKLLEWKQKKLKRPKLSTFNKRFQPRSRLRTDYKSNFSNFNK